MSRVRKLLIACSRFPQILNREAHHSASRASKESERLPQKASQSKRLEGSIKAEEIEGQCARSLSTAAYASLAAYLTVAATSNGKQRSDETSVSRMLLLDGEALHHACNAMINPHDLEGPIPVRRIIRASADSSALRQQCYCECCSCREVSPCFSHQGCCTGTLALQAVGEY